MGAKNSEHNVLRELEEQNPAVAKAFGAFRRHGRPPTGASSERRRALFVPSPQSRVGDITIVSRPLRAPISVRSPLIAFGLVLIGVIAVAIVVGPAFIRFLALYWQAILLPTGGLCVGAGTVILVSRVGASPLRGVAPPTVDPEDPLQELKDLAERTASRLRAAYRLQLLAVLAVGTILMALIVWSMFMVSQNRLVYASAFGSGSVGMLILTQWKWQPFDRIHQARRLADNADTLATGLRLRMKTISEIKEPSKRAKAQWDAVEEYLKRS